MSRRAEDVSVVSLPMTADERAVFDEIKRRSLLDSDANLLRCALWKLVEWYGLDAPTEMFALRLPGRGREVVPAASTLAFNDREREPGLFDTEAPE